jgi:AcrR family transcriptional regulator
MQAARAEFGEHGYGGTDSNKIARRAGFAPQTFYRWYADKTAIFIAVYRRWEEDELAMLGDLVSKRASARKLVDAVVEHHTQHVVFRRSLRWLSVQDDVVRRARADSRLRQIDNIVRWSRRDARRTLKPVDVAVTLLQVERLADAIAERELRDLALDESALRAELVSLLSRLQ